MDEYLAIIKIFAGNFAPRGWQFCQGQTLSIAQNTALFSLLGTTYGGNGQTTFSLPDLRGRAPIGQGQGPGLSYYALGQIGGTENTTLTINNLPAHSHSAPITGAPTVVVNSGNAAVGTPTAGLSLAAPGTGSGRNFSPVNGYIDATPNVALSVGSATAGSLAVTIGSTGGNQPVSIVQPYLAINYIICMQGIFPSRN